MNSHRSHWTFRVGGVKIAADGSAAVMSSCPGGDPPRTRGKGCAQWNRGRGLPTLICVEAAERLSVIVTGTGTPRQAANGDGRRRAS